MWTDILFSRRSAMTTSYENYSQDKCSSYDAQGRIPVQLPEILAQLPAACSVLDAGCGTGNYLVPLVNSGKVAQYTGIDNSPAMVHLNILFFGFKKLSNWELSAISG